MPFIIVDNSKALTEGLLFVKHDVLEGWIFSRRITNATEFPDEESARKVIEDHFKELKPVLLVRSSRK